MCGDFHVNLLLILFHLEVGSFEPDKSSDGMFDRARNIFLRTLHHSTASSNDTNINKVISDSDDNDNLIATFREVLKKRKSSRKDRLGMVAYVPNSMSHAYQFLVLLYGSWRYIVDHQMEFSRLKTDVNNLNNIDVLVFCHPLICKEITHVCTFIQNLKEINTTTQQRCWAVEQPFEIDIPYGPLNSFVMFNRTDITELENKYKYLLRTDNDVFVTPAMYLLKPKRLLHGTGGYSDPFNMARLKQISKRLGMTHRGRHSIGSTWCADTKFFIKVAKKTLEVTRYVWLNEFNPLAKGLETINLKANSNGEWIRWWRPVSLLYGGELVLNDMVKDLSNLNKGRFDSSSCDTISIWATPHIHCWHNDCEFQKFKFAKYLSVAISGRQTLPGEIVHRIIENTYSHDISKMNLREYATFIAWNSVGKYLRKSFV